MGKYDKLIAELESGYVQTASMPKMMIKAAAALRDVTNTPKENIVPIRQAEPVVVELPTPSPNNADDQDNKGDDDTTTDLQPRE
jgi:hypothetical protein